MIYPKTEMTTHSGTSGIKAVVSKLGQFFGRVVYWCHVIVRVLHSVANGDCH